MKVSAIRRSIRCRRRAAGFTVVELAVSLLLMVVVMLGMLALFDFSNRLSHVQTNVADMQQSQRIAQQDVMRTIRMLGRGPIPLGSATSNGVAMTMWDQVPAGTRIGGPNTPEVLAGTDILTVRGVFSSPVFQVNALAPGTFAIQTVAGGFSGHVNLSNLTPTSIPQDLQALKDALDSANQNATKPRERLVLIDARNLDRWSIVALNATGSTVASDLSSAHLEFSSLPADDPVFFDMPTGFPLAGLSAVAFIGILEEHRFYIRQAFETAPNGTQDLASMFTRARVFPGTDRPWRGLGDNMGIGDDAHENWKIDVSDNIVDLQIALGFDSPRGGGRITDDANNIGDDDRIFESADGHNDDWLYNSDQAVVALDWANLPLYFVRLTTLARTDRRDTFYQAPLLARLENHNLTASRYNAGPDRMFRYRPLQTFIDMRNLH